MIKWWTTRITFIHLKEFTYIFIMSPTIYNLDDWLWDTIPNIFASRERSSSFFVELACIRGWCWGGGRWPRLGCPASPRLSTRRYPNSFRGIRVASFWCLRAVRIRSERSLSDRPLWVDASLALRPVPPEFLLLCCLGFRALNVLWFALKWLRSNALQVADRLGAPRFHIWLGIGLGGGMWIQLPEERSTLDGRVWHCTPKVSWPQYRLEIQYWVRVTYLWSLGVWFLPQLGPSRLWSRLVVWRLHAIDIWTNPCGRK